MFEKTRRIIAKNMKLIMRSKASALIIFLGPLLLILLVGIAFNTADQYRITAGVFVPNYHDNNLSQGIITKLEQSGIDVVEYPLSDACIDSVKTEESNVCLIFPERFDLSAENASTDIQLHLDYSEINLVYTILDIISSQVSEHSREITAALTGDLLARLSTADAEVTKRVPAIVSVVTAHDTITIKADEIYTSLQGMDLQVNAVDLGIESVQDELRRLREISLNIVLEAQVLVDSVNLHLGQLAGNKTEVQQVLSRSDTDFNAYEVQLRSIDASLTSILSNFSQEMNVAQAKMGTALATRNMAMAKLDEIRNDLTTTIDHLNQVQAGLNNIKKAVANLEVKNAERIATPITTRIMPVTSKKTHFNYLFPTLLILVVMITSVLLGTTLMLSEKKSRAYFRNQITPTNDITFLFGTFLTSLFIVAFQLLIYIFISSIFFEVAIIGSLGMTFLIVLTSISLFTFLGILLGALYKSEATAILASITVSSIMLLFSSSMLPLESMHPALKALASWNPFVVSTTLLKDALFFDFAFSHLASKLFLLIFYGGALFLVALVVQRWLRVHTLFYYHKLPRKTGSLQAGLVALVERESGVLGKIFPSLTPSQEALLAETRLDPLERSLLADAGAVSPATTAAVTKEAKKEMSAERKMQIETEIGRLREELKKL